MKDLLTQLKNKHNSFVKSLRKLESDHVLAQAKELLEELRKEGANLSDPEDRKTLSSLTRNLGEIVFNLSGQYPSVRLAKFVEPPSERIFVNREEELNRILPPLAPAYHLIDAPAGYGKTALLEELQYRFKQQDWICAYISIQKYTTLPSITNALAHKLKLTLKQESESQPFAQILAEALIEQRGDEFNLQKDGKKGLVLLIDINQKPWVSLKSTIDALFIDFVPQLEKILRRLALFQQAHNPFRVVFAGRYLAGKTPTSIPFRLSALKLKNLDLDVVNEMAELYLPNQEQIKQVAAHIMHYTAGHPGSMVLVLKLYEEKGKGYEPEQFFQHFADEIWENIVWPESDALRQDIDRKLRRIFDDLSIFRYLDYNVLQELLKNISFSDYDDEFDLADALTKSYLMTWQGRFLRDDITRRLLVLRFLREIGTKQFRLHCQRARKICVTQLQSASTQIPERWTIEYWFQSLQQYTEEVSSQQRRCEIKEHFFNHDLSTGLQLLVKNRAPRVEHAALKRALETDWEFGFTVNYYLRDKQYSDQPYQDLQENIDSFFTEKQSGENNA